MPFPKPYIRLAAMIACIAPATAGALSPPQATSDPARSDTARSDTARSDPARAPDPRTAIYELRTYYPAPGKLAALNARFREHTLALFARHGMTNVAYWNEAPSPEVPDGRVIYVLAYPDRAARDAAWKAFGSDPEWRAVAAASEANGKLVAKVDSVVMTMTDYSPPLSLKRR